jgi:tRNA(adenine34) deaminase
MGEPQSQDFNDAVPRETYMNIALSRAKEAYARNEVPVGAVVVWQGEVIASAGNLVESHKDVIAHAEILALREASKNLGRKWLDDCDLYVTLEPCAMCAGAISHTRIRRLYFGAWDTKMGAVENGPRLFSQPTCHHKPEVYSGIHATASESLMKEFFASKR